MRCILLLLILITVAPAYAQTQSPTHPIGVANDTIVAHYHPHMFSICAIRPGENVMAVARTESDMLLVYASGNACEGQVWIPESAAVRWQAPGQLRSLPLIEEPNNPNVITDLDDYNAICASASGNSSRAATDVETIYMPGAWSFFPPRFVATSDTGVNAVVCLARVEESLGICPNVRLRVERVQEVLTVTMVDYVTRSIIARETFPGERPDCPAAVEEEMTVLGNPPNRETWQTWLISQMEGRASDRLRTVTRAFRLNARAEDSTRSDIYQVLDQGTPVNLIARNEDGDWVVALLPDMSQAWLFVELLYVAAQTNINDLPVVDGEASDVSIPLP